MPGLTLPKAAAPLQTAPVGDWAGWVSARLRALPQPVPWGLLSWSQKVIPETTKEFYLLTHLLQVGKRVRQVTAD